MFLLPNFPEWGASCKSGADFLRLYWLCGATGGMELSKLGSAGELGTPLLPNDLALVQLKPLRPFTAGELCAYLAGMGPATAAARAAQRRADGLSGAQSRPSQQKISGKTCIQHRSCFCI